MRADIQWASQSPDSKGWSKLHFVSMVIFDGLGKAFVHVHKFVGLCTYGKASQPSISRNLPWISASQVDFSHIRPPKALDMFHCHSWMGPGAMFHASFFGVFFAFVWGAVPPFHFKRDVGPHLNIFHGFSAP